MRRLFSVARKRGSWAIADQIIVSGGNFLTGKFVLATLSREHSGTYLPLLAAMLVINSLHNALVVYPLSVKGATSSVDELKRLSMLCLTLTGVLMLPLGLGMIGAVSYYAAGYSSPLTVGLAVLLAMLGYQVQETMRRALISHARFSAAIPGDVICYVGQATLVWFLTKREGFCIEWVFLSMATMAMVATIFQVIQIGIAKFSLKTLKESARKFWTMGRWVMMSNMTMLITAQGYYIVMEMRHGKEANAMMGALGYFMNLTNPLVFSVVGLIIPAVARARAESGIHHAKKVGLFYVALGFIPIIIYYLMLFNFPEFAAKLLLGGKFEEYADIGSFLRPFVFIGMVGYVANTLIAVLNGMSMSRTNFIAQSANVAATLLIGLPLTYKFGVNGQIYGGLAATMILTAATTFLFMRAK